MGLFLVPLGYAGYRMTTFALTSPRFTIDSPERIVVSGNHFVSRDEILAALGEGAGRESRNATNIFSLSLERNKAQVESIPWVRSATLVRAYPNCLAISILERTPIAFVNLGGRVKLVDTDGVILERPEKAIFNFPMLIGLERAGGSPDHAAQNERLSLYQEFIRQLDSETAQAGWLISEVDVTDSDDVKGLLVEGPKTIQAHFGHKDFLERFRNFLALLPDLEETRIKIGSVDLRYRNQIVVNPAPGPVGITETPRVRRGGARMQEE